MESRLYQIVSIYLDLLEKQKKKPGRPEKISRREYFEEIMYVLRTGIQWRNLRGKLHWSSYYKKFSQWAKAKVFSNLSRLFKRY